MAERIAVGQERTGQLENSELIGAKDASRYYQITLKEAEGIEIEMTSEDLDSYLEIRPTSSEGLRPLDTDDDGGDEFNARLRFSAPRAGDYTIRARSTTGEAGQYKLSVKAWTPPPRAVAIPLPPSAKVTGELADGGPLLFNDLPYALYTFNGRKGERILIDLKSSEFDPLIRIQKTGLSDAEFSLTNDDGGRNDNAKLFTILPDDGEYTLEAISISGKLGKYELSLREFAEAASKPPIALTLSKEERGNLSYSSPTVENATGDRAIEPTFYEEYIFEGTSGDVVTVDLVSEDFDPMLQAGLHSPVGFAVVDTNDDGVGAGTAARLVLTFQKSGPIFLRAIAATDGDKLGDFRIRVRPGRRGVRMQGGSPALR